jgi:hypothetical protein
MLMALKAEITYVPFSAQVLARNFTKYDWPTKQ